MTLKTGFQHLFRSTLLCSIILLGLFHFTSCSKDDKDGPEPMVESPPVEPPPEEPKPQINSTILDSKFSPDRYPIKTYLPASYSSNNSLPVLYVLDGEYYFQIIVDHTEAINLDAIVVGIGDFLVQEEWVKRNRDFLPSGCRGTLSTSLGISEEDGSLDFYNFISQQVIPFIDEKYENDHSSRSLIGHGKPAIFSTVSMLLQDLDDPLFHGFLSVNPGVIEGSLSDLLCDADFFDAISPTGDGSTLSKNIRFHFSEAVGYEFGWFNEYLIAKEYSWLDIDFQVYGDKGFIGVEELSFVDGLKFIYDL